MRGAWAVFLALGIAAPVAAQPDGPTWKVGLARADVTPEGPIWLAGYASRNKPSEGVLARLLAGAMAIEDADGRRALIVTADVIGFRAEVAEMACRAIAEKTGLQRDQILLNWSHTHTGPVIGLAGNISYSIPEEEKKIVDAYTRALIAKYGELAAAALEDLKPARLSWGLGIASLVMNRREFTDRGVRLGVNPRGYADRSLLVFRVDDPQGKCRAVLYGCACHNTTLTGEHYQISGDYAGFTRQYIEDHLPGVQAMFLIGCGGDANPYPRSQIDHVKQHGQTLGAEVCRVAAGKLQPIGGRLRTVLEFAKLPLEPMPDRETLQQMVKGPSHLAHNARRMLQMVEQGESLPAFYNAPIAVWQLGEDLTLVALPGEVVSDFVPLIEEAIGHTRLWIAGYSNDVFGYLPSAKVLREGGYETRGLYTSVGFFTPKAQDVVVQTVERLARQAGRPALP